MDVESFKNLIEIQGLKNRQDQHQKLCESALKRISQLSENQSEAKTHLEETKKKLLMLKSSIQSTEQELSILEKQQAKSKSDLMQVQNMTSMQGLERDIHHREEVIQNISDKLLSQMMEQEESQKELLRLENFLQGLSKTIPEITEEVNLEVAKNKREIQYYQERIDSLFCEIPEAKHIVNACWNKNKKAIVSIENEACECGLIIGKNFENQIEKAQQIFTCSSCERIFIPYKSSHS